MPYRRRKSRIPRRQEAKVELEKISIRDKRTWVKRKEGKIDKDKG